MRRVPLLVGRDVAQPEVGAEVDDPDAAVAQRRDDRRGGAVRVGDDRGVDVARAVEVELLEHRAARGGAGRARRARRPASCAR